MVNLTAVGGEQELPKTHFQRHLEAKAALQAARESLDAAERRLEDYHRALERVTKTYQAYMRQEAEAVAKAARIKAMDEITETVMHLRDAVHVWWPHLTLAYWMTDARDTFGSPQDAA